VLGSVRELAVEAERDVVRDLRPCQLVQRRRVQHEQERVALTRVEHDREEDTLVLGVGIGGGDEYRLARVAAVLAPGRGRALDDIGLPAIIRPSFTMGGTGGGIAYTKAEIIEIDPPPRR